MFAKNDNSGEIYRCWRTLTTLVRYIVVGEQWQLWWDILLLANNDNSGEIYRCWRTVKTLVRYIVVGEQWQLWRDCAYEQAHLNVHSTQIKQDPIRKLVLFILLFLVVILRTLDVVDFGLDILITLLSMPYTQKA